MTARPLARTDAALRPATLGDVDAMATLINRYAAQGLMLPKTRGELCRAFREYLVVTGPEGEVVACGGLRVYSPELGELVGLAVEESWQGRGLGPTLVARVLDEARLLGLSRVLAMALDAGFYHRLGFVTIPREWVPEKVASDCRGCARRAGCREVAVMADLTGPRPGVAARRRRSRGPAPATRPEGTPARRGRRELRVLAATGASDGGAPEPAR